VIRTLRQVDPSKTCAVHVDAIWTSDHAGVSRIIQGNDWRIVRRGPSRHYAAGVYRHADHLGAAGYDAALLGPLTIDSLEAFATGFPRHHRGTTASRDWTADPSSDDSATSTSLHVTMNTARPPVEGPSVFDACWTARGWFHEEDSRGHLDDEEDLL
jgi:hypothetical protein